MPNAACLFKKDILRSLAKGCLVKTSVLVVHANILISSQGTDHNMMEELFLEIKVGMFPSSSLIFWGHMGGLGSERGNEAAGGRIKGGIGHQCPAKPGTRSLPVPPVLSQYS